MEQPVAPTSTGPDAVERKWLRIRLYSLLAIPILLFVVPWLAWNAAKAYVKYSVQHNPYQGVEAIAHRDSVLWSTCTAFGVLAIVVLSIAGLVLILTIYAHIRVRRARRNTGGGRPQ